MKQDISIFVEDSFIDYKGREHKIVACALSQSPSDKDFKLMTGWIDTNGMLDSRSALCQNVYRMVTVAIAICNPEDEFDLEKGKQQAYNKAANIETLPRLYTSNKGVITKELVDAFIKQQINFFKENPETLIKGYKEAKEAYENIQKAKNTIDNFSEEEKTVFNLAIKGVDFSKYVNLAKIYIQKILK